ncbi:hypothetical protein SODALDRAFT_55740 [Sodiomyces alkalinus F11]|uniref:Uncharacterized protein n=1 Tax=Sodiomyces alkalinus (strain CBS 110278 / VKM F-3762 / F11) TaxID=1314773 RepID=A0A3N2PNR7_SODAK|nr:hypothetical protein SODALDRAFT_55740 [Sodiomyces alkalinus F11]ROT35986.1 hypothetical protein SODALDRAFT_55740 [Sodiomyces alkalinus F11]
MQPTNSQMKSAATASLRKKVVHSVDTPYSATPWPDISTDNQEAILELLCRFLAPLGQCARSKQPSKGKRSRKRKRKMEPDGEPARPPIVKPPPPETAPFVDVGLSSITRTLQELVSQHNQPIQLPAPELDLDSDSDSSQQPYAVIFIARSGYPSAFTSHFPEMVAAASRVLPSASPIRLVGYSKSCADRLSASLGISRVSSVGIRQGAPMSQALIDYVRDCVPPIVVRWLQEAESAEYRHTCLVAEEKMVSIQKTSQQ